MKHPDIDKWFAMFDYTKRPVARVDSQLAAAFSYLIGRLPDRGIAEREMTDKELREIIIESMKYGLDAH